MSREEWVLHAGSEIAQQDHAKKIFGGAVAGGALMGLTGAYPLGVAAILGGIAWTHVANNRKIKDLRILAKIQSPAPFLRGEDFQEYREFVGDEALKEEYKLARRYGASVSPDLEDLIEEKAPSLLDAEPEREDVIGIQQQTLPVPPSAIPSHPPLLRGSEQPPFPIQPEPDEDVIEVPATEEESDPLPQNAIENFFPHCRYRPTLLWGGQGSGKTTLAKVLLADKQQYGHKTIVINPHGSSAAWKGVKVIGAGRNFGEVSQFLSKYIQEVSTRYHQFEESGLSEDQFLEELIKKGRAMTVLCEEMSSWSANLNPELLDAFSRCALTESRKVAMPVVFVAHDPSLDFLGLKRGAKLRDQGMVIISLEAGQPDARGVLQSTGKGSIALPGNKDEQPIVFSRPIETQATEEPESQGFMEKALQTVRRTLGAEDYGFNLDALPEDLKVIALYSIKKTGWVTARKCKADISKFRSSGITTTEIRQKFQQLADRRCGVVSGEGETLKYSAFREDGK